MKKIILPIIALVLTVVYAYAQEEEIVDKPVVEPFGSGYLIDNQTTMVPYPKTLEFVIQHKFATIENGMEDVFGIYGSANIRLALNFVVMKNLQVGYGLTKTDMVHDFSAKWTFLEQTRKNSVPVSVSLYGNMGISGLNEEDFGANYEFSNRFSYFYQLNASRKFTDRITLQAGASFSHFNQSDTSKYDYDRIGLHLLGRFKITEQGSIIFNYDQPLKAFQLPSNEDVKLYPNLALGYEIATVSHAFQMYLGYTKQLLPQYVMVRENKEFDFNQFCFGFVITRLTGY